MQLQVMGPAGWSAAEIPELPQGLQDLKIYKNFLFKSLAHFAFWLFRILAQ